MKRYWPRGRGETHSIEEFLTLAFSEVGLDDWHNYVRQDPRFFRPAEVDLLIGDPTKAREKLGWVPQITLQEMVKEMVQVDLDAARQHALLKQHGYSVAVSRE